jgi:hypothetical protein
VRIATAILFLLVASGTSVSQVRPVQNVEIKQSPAQLVKAINSQRNFVQAGIYLKILWEDLGIPPGSFGPSACDYECIASLYLHELNAKPGLESVIQLSGNEVCRFLIFTRENRSWHFLGYVDHNFNRYEMATHRVVQVNGHKWLAVHGQTGSGTGFSLYSDTLYEVSDKGIVPVLSYWSKGHTFPWPNGLGRKFKTLLKSSPGDKDGVALTYVVEYTMLDYMNDRHRVWQTNTHRARYRWDMQTDKFVFDAQRSNISEAELTAIANAREPTEDVPTAGNTSFPGKQQFIGGGYQVFLKHNLPMLTRLAGSNDERRKEWLRQILRESEDTEEKRQLLRALGDRL